MTPTATRISLGRLASIVAPWRGVLGYATFTLVLFVLALLYELPHDLIARRAIDEATREIPVRVVFDEVSFSFPNGYRLEGVRVSHRDDPGLGVRIAEITVSTPLLGILLGQIDSAHFSGSLYDGTFAGSTQASDGTVATTLALQDVSLAPLSRRLLPPPGVLGGTASLDLEISGDGRSTKTTEGTIDLRAHDVSLEGVVAQGFTVPDLRFRTLTLDAEIEGARLQIESLQAAGDEVTLAAKGNLLIREPAARSVLNVQFEIDVSPDARPGLRVATALLPPPKAGQKGWSLRGSLASPSLR